MQFILYVLFTSIHHHALTTNTMATLKEDVGLATQTEVDLAAQVHYEESLAACYEAEYMLSLRMDEELRSGGQCKRYDYEDESEIVAGAQATEGQGWSVVGGLTADCYDQTEDCLMDCSGDLLGSKTPGGTLNGEQHSCIESSNGEFPFSHHPSRMSSLLPGDYGAVANGEAFSFHNEWLGPSCASSHHRGSPAEVGGCHSEGPCRKKCRLQRPEC